MALDSSQAPVIFGEVLFDRFTDPTTGRVTEVLGGAAFNVGWNLQAFEQSPRFVSRVGDDALAQRIRAAMDSRGMTQICLQRDPEHPTGTVEVDLVDGEPRYEIVAERAYDFIDQTQLPSLAPGTLLYHGVLAARHPVSAAALRALRRSPEVAVFVDVNLRDPWWTREQVLGWIDGATWVKLNQDELAQLGPADGTPATRAKRFVKDHGLAAVFVTLGAQGAFAITADGESEHLEAPQVSRFVDAVGAGDGFASVLILGLLHGWRLRQTLERAQNFASAIVGQRGATSTDPDFYQAFVRQWMGA